MLRMPNKRAARLAELVKSALERGPEERSAFLDEECRSDSALRAEIESLLDHQEGASRFIEMPAMHLAAESLVREGTFRTGQIIGDYEIVSLIGSGGMGEVYLAEDRQLHRKVALKLIRRGMDSEDIVRHFKREEHLLASLNHPNISQLYGGGVSVGGIPFFAMEYVEGQRLDEYCDERGLGTKERLQLFRKVCAAVTYAHQHLVIHRDLKPANIHVTIDGEPKLLDFGIAKLLDVDNAQSSGQTVTLQGVMTPDYASPEQVRGETMTTTSDVYSLGVVLYKLLTGQSPYRTKTNRPDEIVRAITEQNPERPSTAVKDRDSVDSRFTIHDSRALRGDLDNIVLMALRKEPGRRYQSAGQFSADIQRHLDGLPVIARKDTFQYRSTKFIKRHRIGIAAALLILVSLIGGMIATLWQAHAARQESAKAEEIKNFLKQTLDHTNQRMTGKNNRETTLTELLDEAAKRLETGEFSDQPEVRAELEQIIAQSYFGEGNAVSANKHAEEYVKLQNELYGENDPRAIDALGSHAWLLFRDGKLTASEKAFRNVLPRARLEQKKGNIKAATLAGHLNGFAYLRRTQGDSKEAESLFREALDLSAQMSTDEWRYVNGTTRSTLASTLADQGRFEEALQTSREAVTEHRQRRETDTVNFGFALTVLGGLLTEKGDYVEADATLREAEANNRRFTEPSNLWVGDNLRNQAISFYQQGRYAESLSKVTEALKMYREFGTHYDQYPTALIIQGLILAKTGQPKEGESILREAVRIRTESLPKGHYWIGLANSALGECLTIEKRYQEAEPLLVESYESLTRSQGSNNPRTKLALQRLVNLYEAWNKPDQAGSYRALLPAPTP